MDGYHALCAEAEKDPSGFWAKLAREHILWHKPFSRVLDETNHPFFTWFDDGELNVSYNCLDRHLETQPDKIALIFEADDGTIRSEEHTSELQSRLHLVCRLLL